MHDVQLPKRQRAAEREKKNHEKKYKKTCCERVEWTHFNIYFIENTYHMHAARVCKIGMMEKQLTVYLKWKKQKKQQIPNSGLW